MLAQKLLSAMAGGSETLFSDEVFSAYTRTGTGTDVTVTTGIDMTKGYMLWSKGRSGATDHAIYDSARGVTKDLVSNSAAAETTQSTGLKSVTSTGHTVGSLAKVNTNAATYVDYVFARAPKFFDVVTYTGNGNPRTIAHSLGVAPGMVIVKRTNDASSWIVYHRSTGATKYLYLDSTAAEATSSAFWNDTEPTATEFSLGLGTAVNFNGDTFVAYLFAHDPSADGIIQCGSFTTDGSGNATVDLGWEPQYLMFKSASGTSPIGDWYIEDAMRGLTTSQQHKVLSANTSAAENAGSGTYYATVPTSTGFRANSAFCNPSITYIYLAIRRPNKPPTTGTQVYNAIARTGTGAAATVTGVGFAPDFASIRARTGAEQFTWVDKLRGRSQCLLTGATNAESTTTTTTNDVTSFDMDGISVGANQQQAINSNAVTFINHFFKRAPGVFDVVCYTGDGLGGKTVSHGLGVAPELMIYKCRSETTEWQTHLNISGLSAKTIRLNTTAAALGTVLPQDGYYAAPTAATLTITDDGGFRVNGVNRTYVAYLFATKAGISKVFNYTGNGSSQTINCGFTTGARFVLIKRTDSTGDWYVWDTVRGIIAGNDPHMSLNTTAAEVTTNDSIDPDSSGFIVNQVTATNINVTSATYIGLAFA